MNPTKPPRPSRAVIAACVLLLTCVAALATAAGDRPGVLALGCSPAADDEILEIICDRVVADVSALAGEQGYRVIDADGGSADAREQPVIRSIRITLDATRPPGRFDVKQIDARLVGAYGTESAGAWESELSAKGTARDLVHPVADALVTRVSAFLASSPTQ